MLLRSSSTPLIQSHFSDTTDPLTIHHHSSPKSLPISNSRPNNSLRRAKSETNLHKHTSSSSSTYLNSLLTCKYLNKPMDSLRTEPSFCIYNSEEDGVEGFNQNEEERMKSLTIGDNGEFSFGKKSMGLIEEKSDDDEEEEKEEGRVFNDISDLVEDEIEPPSPPMYLATAFGIDRNGVGGAGVVDLTPVWAENGGDVEEYYRKMVTEEDPSNPLFLRNYAQLLQSKGDFVGAEEYYFRATLADPKDGEILMQYAKLVWELRHNQDVAKRYFEYAARASPQDSNVLAAYASFLWEIDEDDSDDYADTDHIQAQSGNTTFEEVEKPVSPPLHLAAGLEIDVGDYSAPLLREGENLGEYYKRMVDENPHSPLCLRNYAKFLSQSKGDLERAEEYYSRAVVADPMDGDLLSQYANLVWQLHHDRDKASNYFEQAVQATPADCNVLAAYAGFLWETGEDEEECRYDSEVQIKMPPFQGHDVSPTHA